MRDISYPENELLEVSRSAYLVPVPGASLEPDKIMKSKLTKRIIVEWKRHERIETES